MIFILIVSGTSKLLNNANKFLSKCTGSAKLRGTSGYTVLRGASLTHTLTDFAYHYLNRYKTLISFYANDSGIKSIEVKISWMGIRMEIEYNTSFIISHGQVSLIMTNGHY